MIVADSSGVSRRAFCLCCLASAGFAATGTLTPRQAFAEARGLVSLIKDSAATSPIVVHKLRNNISAVEGSGGNIAVLTGPDGKVLVDAGIGVSRPQLMKALARPWPRASYNAHQYALALRPYRWKHMAQLRRRKNHRAGQYAQVPWRSAARRRLGLQFLTPGARRNADRDIRRRARSQAQWRVSRT